MLKSDKPPAQNLNHQLRDNIRKPSVLVMVVVIELNNKHGHHLGQNHD